MRKGIFIFLILTLSACNSISMFIFGDVSDVAPCVYRIPEENLYFQIRDQGRVKAMLIGKSMDSLEDTLWFRKDPRRPVHAHFYLLENGEWIIKASSDTTLIHHGPHIISIGICSCDRYYSDDKRRDKEDKDFYDIIDYFEEDDICFHSMMYFLISHSEESAYDGILPRNVHRLWYKPSPKSFYSRIYPIKE